MPPFRQVEIGDCTLVIGYNSRNVLTSTAAQERSRRTLAGGNQTCSLTRPSEGDQIMSMSQNPFSQNPFSQNPFAQNPYLSPSADVYQAEMIHDDQLWRKGKLLVMHKAARLPNRCVKSNVPTERRLKRSLSWHHPLIFAIVLVNLLIYLIVALAVRKTAKISIGLSDKWFAKRHRAIFIGWTLVLASIGLFVAGIVMVDQNDMYALLFLASFLVFLTGAIYGLLAARMVAPTRITDTHIWLSGVCPEFLRELPEWPHTP